MTRPAVLIISSVDPSGGAGLLADLRAVESCECRPLAAVAALTAQNDQRVFGVYPQSPAVVEAQIKAAASAGCVEAVKIGLLPASGIVRAVAALLKSHRFPHIVVDPVFRSSSGSALTDDDVPQVMREVLFPIAEVVTPNLHETAVMTKRPASSLAEMRSAAAQLLRCGMQAVVIKGGHLADSADDLYASAEESMVFESPRIMGAVRRGTGCAFASALACALARGLSRTEAVRFAKDFTRACIEHAAREG